MVSRSFRGSGAGGRIQRRSKQGGVAAECGSRKNLDGLCQQGNRSRHAHSAYPVNVRAKAGANPGNEITWDTEVDLVSGLGGFIVLRDGHGSQGSRHYPRKKSMAARSSRACPSTIRPSHLFPK